uniref:UPAR/Ly6 domain-containing protein n=2 Tax=Pygocentrus nattereri TaxID=42514 RepID=A0A3B4EHE8_PYGNA
IMKVLLMTLVLTLFFAGGSALQCYNCIELSGEGCYPSPQMCGYEQNACVSATYNFPPYNTFQRCINMTDCLILQTFYFVNAQCCETDLCNNVDYI